MPRLLVIACLILAGCGADGPPERPAKPGITVEGEARVGVAFK